MAAIVATASCFRSEDHTLKWYAEGTETSEEKEVRRMAIVEENLSLAWQA